MRRLLFFLPMICFIFTSCYEDEGNYDYDESIKDISVKLEPVYGVKLSQKAFSCTIEPEITTFDNEKSYLKYTWVMVNEATGVNDTLSTDEKLVLEMDPTSDDFRYNYKLHFYVTDTRTNGVTLVPTTVEVVQPYTFTWLVLHEKDGHAEIGSVDYGGTEPLLTLDAYTKDQGQSLTGKPCALMVYKNKVTQSTAQYYWNYPAQMISEIFLITSNSDVNNEGGWLSQASFLSPYFSYNDAMSYSTNYMDIDKKDIRWSTGDNGLMFSSKGKVYKNCTYSPSFGEFYQDPSLTGDCYITHCANANHIGVGYDQAGHRFVMLNYNFLTWYGPARSLTRAGLIEPIRATVDNAADPNQIPADEKIIRIVNGYQYQVTGIAPQQRFSAYAYSLCSNNRSKVYVFRYRNFRSDEGGPLYAVYSFPTPEGIKDGTPMSSSYIYNNILFYAVGNKVYKLDFVSGQSTLIYTYDDASAIITNLRMAIEGYVDTTWPVDDYGHPYNQTLGASVEHTDGTGALVVLQLNSAGKLDADKIYPSIQVYKGFGKITDFDFVR